MRKLFFLFLLINCLSQASANEIKIIDGDTIKINGEKIRFFGIDAPEIDQECNHNLSQHEINAVAMMELEKGVVLMAVVLLCVP